jgi:ankyrin repeat protein
MNLIQAIIKNDQEKIIELLGKGIDSNASNDTANVTPLHFAAQHDSLEAAQLLITDGANIWSQTDDGYTPLDIAMLHGSNNIKKLLINFISGA